MRKNPFSEQREQILAEAIRPVASELRLVDAADLISLLKFEHYGSLADLVSSAAELYFHPGTVTLGVGGNYRLEWDSEPEVELDLEIKPQGVTIYAKLALSKNHAGVEINHIDFKNPAPNPEDNTVFLRNALASSRYYTGQKAAMAG
ncbi:hypothetical protein [Rhizobium sp. C4]|uniref:hypothetical protein n=1 Tax=Rhizobium sp. C4 TaxID=1349800 RepID=UPI001E61CB79|nr:hypothetical protein [Rhizobium sp. C4]MCD2172687.1 hypothetical protein [Rhizobium sp. C4]